MFQKRTVKLPANVALRVRRLASGQNTSVSRLLRRILQARMLHTKSVREADQEAYWQAYRQWQQIAPFDLDASHRLTREQAHHRPSPS